MIDKEFYIDTRPWKVETGSVVTQEGTPIAHMDRQPTDLEEVRLPAATASGTGVDGRNGGVGMRGWRCEKGFLHLGLARLSSVQLCEYILCQHFSCQ